MQVFEFARGFRNWRPHQGKLTAVAILNRNFLISLILSLSLGHSLQIYSNNARVKNVSAFGLGISKHF